MPWFVYVRRSHDNAIEAQRFDEWPYVNGKPLKVVQEHKLNKLEMHCRLKFLEKKYPYKPTEDLT